MSTFLDLVGAGCLIAFAFFVWAPLSLLVAGALALVASSRMVRG